MIGIKIFSGNGKKIPLKISDEGQAEVVVHPHPPKSETISAIPFTSFFKTAAGSSNMVVDGSSTPVEFSISANTTQDIYIKVCSVVIAQQNAVLNKFGNITALTNGLTLKWVTGDLGTETIADSLKTNFDFVQLGLGQPAFGDGTTAFRAGNVISTDEGYLPVIDFSKIFGLQYGLRLRASTSDKLVWTVRDALAGVTRFDIKGYGLKI